MQNKKKKKKKECNLPVGDTRNQERMVTFLRLLSEMVQNPNVL